LTSSPVPPRAAAASEAQHPRLFTRLHGAAITAFYLALAFDSSRALPPSRLLFSSPAVFAVGAVVMAAGTGLALWALISFRSWRFDAKVDKGHELATDGAFAWFRHPIYAALDLLAFGSCVWRPTALVLLACVAVAVLGDARARVEERLMVSVFGDRYRQYALRVQRFVPYVY